ncbi:uncharacterized protein LOC134831191 [Culicoides brevitarsis]|uniref:uncharacterized protein LOC134831191 n=1 Tax=Culicoides brevitarsis TaxID=469753 RepID=UPI00307B8152
MTSTVRHEYSSNVVRELHPTMTTTTSSGFQSKLDDKLDYLLDDLQASVSRPGSSLGQPITTSSSSHHHQSSSSQQVHYLQPANSTTVLRERSTSPVSGQKKFYTATSKYEYKSSSGGGNKATNTTDSTVTDVYKQNINQLDNLLSDLERERDSSLDRKRTIKTLESNVNIDPTLEPGQQKLVKTTTFHQTGEKRVARELLYDPPGTEVVRHSRNRNRSPGTWDNRTVEFVDSGTVDRHHTPNVRSEHFYTESKELSHLPRSPKVHYSEHVSESVGADAVRKLDIDEHLLPTPNTKVTTTVRTYTYELPEEPETGLINKKIHMKDEAYNRTTTTLPSNRAERDIEALPPGSSHTLTTYRQDANDLPTLVNGTPATTNSKSMFYKKETKSSNTTYYPGSPDPSLLPRLTQQPDDGTGRPVHVYQEQITHKGPPGSPVPSDPYGMNTITYRYNSTNTNANVRYPPPEREPLLPAFPVDGVDNQHPDANPPKRVEDLMATFGDTSVTETNYLRRREVAEKPITPTRIEEKQRTLVPIQNPDDQRESTKNVAGSPVYYPPGHEMFEKKEEAAVWTAAGGMARGRGEYEYKAEAKQKSKSKSGAAVVPVCLPLCCAMPCSIM